MKKIFALILSISLIISLSACSESYMSKEEVKANVQKIGGLAINSESESKGSQLGKLLKVSFIDVGQADSILLQGPNGKTMLVDAGNNDDGEKVVSYIKSQGIKRIDILVGTHPHEDHINIQ